MLAWPIWVPEELGLLEPPPPQAVSARVRTRPAQAVPVLYKPYNEVQRRFIVCSGEVLGNGPHCSAVAASPVRRVVSNCVELLG
jgi:hypothetical protein